MWTDLNCAPDRDRATLAGVDYELEIKEVAPQPAVVIRERVRRDRLQDFFDHALDEIAAHIASAGGEISGPSFGRFYESIDDKVDVEAGYPVFEPVDGAGRVAPGGLPSGRVAAAVHEGGYDDIEATHEAVRGYCAEGGYDITGAPWEVYWTGPRDDPDSKSWRTEVVYPVA